VNAEERDEAIKWLKLGHETYGRRGVEAMARALGLSHAADRIDATGPHEQAGAGEAAPVSASPGSTERSMPERWDDLASPNHRALAVRPDGAPRVEVFAWKPVGLGASSFGHMSASVGDRVFSWGPNGMTEEPRRTYLRRNNFRAALGRELDLPMTEAQGFEASLRDYPLRHEYDTFLANCADPVEGGLEELGYPMGVRLSPRDVMEGLVGAGLSQPNDYRIYQARPDQDAGFMARGRRARETVPAPWSWLFWP